MEDIAFPGGLGLSEQPYHPFHGTWSDETLDDVFGVELKNLAGLFFFLIISNGIIYSILLGSNEFQKNYLLLYIFFIIIEIIYTQRNIYTLGLDKVWCKCFIIHNFILYP